MQRGPLRPPRTLTLTLTLTFTLTLTLSLTLTLTRCDAYLFRLDSPPRWVLGPTPGVDRAVMHAELPPGRQVQHARGWMGWIDDAWHEMPTARVHCTHRVN